MASPLGKELDSLADVVTSGVAPGFIVFHLLDAHNGYMKDPVMDILAFSAFLIPLFAAYRLAKFNIDTRQSHSFLGLPVPANALIWAGLALYACPLGTCCFLEWNGPFDNTPFLIALVIISLTTNILMVSEMPMFSLKINFKELGWKSNAVQYIFLIGCALIIGIARQWYAISLIILWYIILSAITQKKHAE